MLSIDYDGESILTVQAARSGLATVTVDALALEDDTTLPVQNVSGTVDWGDGRIELYPVTNGVLNLNKSHEYKGAGRYIVTMEVTNYRYPRPDVVQLRLQVLINPAVVLPVDPSPVVVGPILPRDLGYPNASQWNFNIGQDERILESSLKMLLMTRQGERLMRPSYGTDLWKYVFSPNVEDLEGLIADSIRSAVAANEPRIIVQSVGVRREDNTRNVYVDLIYGSVFNNRRSTLTLPFTAPNT